MGLSPPGVTRYQYGYDATGVGTGSSSFSAWAHGDLDGDGRISSFSLSGVFEDGALRVAPGIEIVDQDE